MKTCLVVLEMLHADIRWKDRRTGMVKLVCAFLQFIFVSIDKKNIVILFPFLQCLERKHPKNLLH
jgi:hypothetical protein